MAVGCRFAMNMIINNKHFTIAEGLIERERSTKEKKKTKQKKIPIRKHQKHFVLLYIACKRTQLNRFLNQNNNYLRLLHEISLRAVFNFDEPRFNFLFYSTLN